MNKQERYLLTKDGTIDNVCNTTINKYRNNIAITGNLSLCLYYKRRPELLNSITKLTNNLCQVLSSQPQYPKLNKNVNSSIKTR